MALMCIPLVSDYAKAKTAIAEISSLSQQILDARLVLTRSKQRHPEPRLTVSSASTQLDSQIMKMQESAEELQRVNAKVSAVKEDIKAKSRRLEALRSQRAELEKVRSSKVDEVEDPRYAGLYDWFVSFYFHTWNRRLIRTKGTRPPSLSTSQFSAWKPSTWNQKMSYSLHTG
jgi:TolA-binding protein